MNKKILPINVRIEKLEEEVVASNGLRYNYEISYQYSPEGGVFRLKTETYEEAINYLRHYSELYVPSWEEVTGNGRWSSE
jgi:hypothetical protein